jgi:hypothetical protein
VGLRTTIKRMHYQVRPAGGAKSAIICGRWDGLATRRIPDVTCKACLKALWREVSLAHYRAFGAGNTDFGRRMRASLRDAEIATRSGI